jgi:uracil-DNA glycosylase
MQVPTPRTVGETASCAGCPMRDLSPSNRFVPPERPDDPSRDLNRLLIGEAPGKVEAKEGRPFAGPSGTVLDNLLSLAGVDRLGLTIINCIQCRPHDNKFPTDPKARGYITKADANRAINHCLKHHVDPVLSSRNWNRVDLVGGKPLRIVAGKTERISQLRGRPLRFNRPGCGELKGLAIFHPMYLMRHRTLLPEAVNELAKSLESES